MNALASLVWAVLQVGNGTKVKMDLVGRIRVERNLVERGRS